MEMIDRISKIETGHTTEEGAGLKAIEEDLVGIEETVDLGIQVDPHLGTKLKREDIIIAENGTFYKKVYEQETGLS